MRKKKEKHNASHLCIVDGSSVVSILLSLYFTLISLFHSVGRCSKCMYACVYMYIRVCVCVYVKETTTKEAQQCLRGRARLNDK